jgi:hypothetical protein
MGKKAFGRRVDFHSFSKNTGSVDKLDSAKPPSRNLSVEVLAYAAVNSLFLPMKDTCCRARPCYWRNRPCLEKTRSDNILFRRYIHPGPRKCQRIPTLALLIEGIFLSGIWPWQGACWRIFGNIPSGIVTKPPKPGFVSFGAIDGYSFGCSG